MQAAYGEKKVDCHQVAFGEKRSSVRLLSMRTKVWSGCFW